MTECTKLTWPRVRFGDVVHLYSEHSHDPEAGGIEPEDVRIRSWGLVEVRYVTALRTPRRGPAIMIRHLSNLWRFQL